jgi:hypothetical protein
MATRLWLRTCCVYEESSRAYVDAASFVFPKPSSHPAYETVKMPLSHLITALRLQLEDVKLSIALAELTYQAAETVLWSYATRPNDLREQNV